MITELNEENFHSYVQNCTKPLLVEFYANWCGYCQQQKAILEEISKKYENEYCFAAVNVDHSGNMAKLFNARSIPTLVVFKNGKITNNALGLHSEAQLIELIKG